MARPHTTYTKDIGEKICELLRSGKAPIEVWEELHVAPSTCRDWRLKFPEFDDEYNSAMEIFYNLELKRAQDESVKKDGDLYVSASGKATPNMAAVRRSEIIINSIHTRLKLMNPDRYGDKYKSWLHDCPEVGDKLSAVDRIELIHKLVAKGRLSLDDAQKLTQIVDSQYKFEELQKLSDEVKQLKEMFSKNEKFN